jgi:predicted HicB family RNase H-like nuclease
MLNYKGYVGEAVYDDDVKMFAGRIVNAKGVGTFYGKTVEELEHEFKQTIDYYIDLCKRKNVIPQQPFSGKFNLRLTPELHRKIYIASTDEGKSVNAWIKEKLESFLVQRDVPPPNKIRSIKPRSLAGSL